MKCNVFELWETYNKDLERYVEHKVRDSNVTYDILQQILFKFINYCESKNDVRNIRGWLFRIAHNTVMDYFEDENKKVLLDFDIVDNSIESNYSLSGWIDFFISELPLIYAEPLILSDLKGTPQKVIASKLGLSLEATKSRIQRARKMLKEKFYQCGVLEINDNQAYEYTPTQVCCLLFQNL